MSLVLGLEHSCPWPREGRSSEGLFLAPNFFRVLSLELCVSTPLLLRGAVISSGAPNQFLILFKFCFNGDTSTRFLLLVFETFMSKHILPRSKNFLSLSPFFQCSNNAICLRLTSSIWNRGNFEQMLYADARGDERQWTCEKKFE